MILNKQGYHIIKTILFFAFSRKAQLSIKELSGRLHISEKVMEQVLLVLKKSGLLLSKRGPKGGYRLARDICDMRMKDLIDKTGQRIEIMYVENENRKDSPIEAIMGDLNMKIEDQVNKKLSEITVSGLVEELRNKVVNTGLDYFI